MALVLKDVEDLLSSWSKLPINDVENLLTTLSGMALDLEFCNEVINKHPAVITNLSKHFIINENELTKTAFDFVINVSSHSECVLKMWNLTKGDSGNSFSEFLDNVVQLMLYSSDLTIGSKAAQFLANLTRENVEVCDEFISLKESNGKVLDDMFRIGLLLNDNLNNTQRDDAAMIILNLSQGSAGQRFIMDNLHLLNDLMAIFKSSPSDIWLLATFGLLKNLLKNSDFHNALLEKTFLLTVLLHPLVGLNDYDPKISKEFPEKLKEFVGKPIELPSGIRNIILEALYLLCATSFGREIMRSSNVYDILKNISELDLTDEESDNCLDCIGILIRTEEEIDCDNLLSLKIPADVQEKFNK